MNQSRLDLDDYRETPAIACGEQTQQRFEAYGAAALSDTELIALLLHCGVQGRSVLQLASQLVGVRPGRLPDSPVGSRETSNG